MAVHGRPALHGIGTPVRQMLTQLCRINQGRVSPSDELTSAKQDVELGKSHMNVTLSVWRDSELTS
ncbi:hypothetical protein TUM17387_05210 [Shewanella carassii]|nr:hypothetical protein TUM17387_05210 [Shewanella carassii]